MDKKPTKKRKSTEGNDSKEPKKALKEEECCIRTCLPDIPTNVIVGTIFPYLDRPTLNAFSVANREIYNEVKNHKHLVLPWPVCRFRIVDEHGSELPLHSSTFSPTGEFIAFGDKTGQIYLLSRKDGLVASWRGHNSLLGLPVLAFSPNGKLLVSSGGGCVKLWNVNNNGYSCLWTRNQNVGSLSFSPSGEFIACGGGDYEEVLLLNVSDGTTTQRVRPSSSIFGPKVAYSPDGKTVAFAGSSPVGGGLIVGLIELWKHDEAENALISFEGHKDAVNCLSYSPDGTYLASTSDDETIKLWNVVQGRCIQTLIGHTDPVRSVSFSPNGKYIASVANDSSIRLWNVADGKCLRKIKPIVPVYYFGSVEFSPDGRLLLSNVAGGELCLHSWCPEGFEFLERDRAKLMRLTVVELKHVLCENDIPFTTNLRKADLVDELVIHLERSQTKEICTHFHLTDDYCSPRSSNGKFVCRVRPRD
jgi:WD40 repeat protein